MLQSSELPIRHWKGKFMVEGKIKRSRVRRKTLLRSIGEPCNDALERGLAAIKNEKVMDRIWKNDHTLWNPAPSQIANRMGWLRVAGVMAKNIGQLEEMAEAIRDEGFTNVVLLGMGGSSLAPTVLGRIFRPMDGYPKLTVIDTTNPEEIISSSQRFDLARSIFVVATKSGNTVETMALFKYFYNKVANLPGQKESAGQRFIAITDPGSSLVDIAERLGFRTTFLNDPNIGGRYSALSCFGMVPAALIGVNVKLMLQRAVKLSSCSESPTSDAAKLGVLMGEMAMEGRNKLTLIVPPALESFGMWVEQLIAESTGKGGKGILPVIGENLGQPEVYAKDRFFVYLRMKSHGDWEKRLSNLEIEGQPVVSINLRDRYDLGEQFFLWEMATAIAGWRMGINPFDQPNVEASKEMSRRIISQYMDKGTFPKEDPSSVGTDIKVFGGPVCDDAAGALIPFVTEELSEDGYIALQSYLQPTRETERLLQLLRIKLRDRFRVATTVGYGPRFLHSTGQLHKGDAGRGLFIQFTAEGFKDVSIPDEPGSPPSSLTFGILQKAQADGDREALGAKGRKVIRFHLLRNVAVGLKSLVKSME